MARSTARYRFEFKMVDWAQGFVRSLCGQRVSLFVGLRADGTVRRVYCARPGADFAPERRDAMTEAHPVWLLYAPYDDPDTAYLEWFGLDREVAEQWLGPLERDDFVDVRGTEPRDDWPSTWRVIVV